MDVKELIKLQLISKPDGSNVGKTIKYLIALSILDESIKHVGSLLNFLKSRFNKKISEKIDEKQTPLVQDSVLLDKRHSFNQVFMKRDWKTTLESFQETNLMVDAILNIISKLDNIPKLQVIENTQTLINYLDKPFQITRDIFAKVETIDKDPETGMVTAITMILMSNTLSSCEITKWAKHMYILYKEQVKNALGDNLYFFDHKNRVDQTDPRGSLSVGDDSEKSRATHRVMKIATAPRQLNFIKSPFYSNKSFVNIFGDEVREVEERVNFFLNNREWYDSRGIPYQLGLLLSGVPGSGKTSIIRAIANLTKRHIINVNFANISTATQLKNLFFSDKITVYTDSTMSNFDVLTIPLENRIYVLEEIDAISNIVKQRVDGEVREEPIPDELTLGEILTVLDGTLESPGRIVIMTSNRPEILDKALVRPGRIDVSVNFGYAKKELIIEMYQCFFGRKFPKELVEKLPNEKLTAAEIGQVLFRHFKNPEPQNILENLLECSNISRGNSEIIYKQIETTWEPSEELGGYASWIPDEK
jgi:ATP-dependent 26S proteasome regulatory subunit